MSEKNPGADVPHATGFSKEYVEQLRQEAAGWRRKFQDLNAKGVRSEIDVELAHRGIKAEANWVERTDGMTAAQAVDAFAAKYPHLAVPATTPAPAAGAPVTRIVQVGAPAGTPGVMPKPEGPGKGAGAAPHGVVAPLESVRNLNEIKNDPKARAAVAANYRELLRNNGIATPPDA